MSNPKVSASVREGLNVESGLNDGICVPVLLMFLALLVEEQTQSPLSLAVELVVEELGIGAVIGIALTLGAWRLAPGAWRLAPGCSVTPKNTIGKPPCGRN